MIGFDSMRTMTMMSCLSSAIATPMLIVPSPSFAQEELNSVAATQSVTVKVTIEAIDRATRIVTLKGLKGNSVAVHADERVKRFNDLKVGDEVVATYSESVAVNRRRSGEAIPAKGFTPDTQKPGGTTTVQQTITISVEGIDRPAQRLTVKGPEGHVVSFRVRDPCRISRLAIRWTSV
jgi:hypothetical protein